MRLLNPHFKWAPPASTNVADTWRRFGFKPTTDEERKAAQERLHAQATVTTMQPGTRKVAVPPLRLTVKK